MLSYQALKYVHVTCVVFSGLGFCLRAWWMLHTVPALQWRLTRVLPHLLDTILLSSALLLAYLSGQYPFAQDWLTAKLFGLLAYIFLGTIALKRGKTQQMRASAAVMAVLAYLYVISAALSRSPWLI